MTPLSSTSKPRVLIYILRRDIRLSDNPIFHHASLLSSSNNDISRSPASRAREDSLITNDDTPIFTHLLPVYVFPAEQVEVSGFLADSSQQCPYPEARSRIAHLWRTGPHRANFMAEGVWDLKERLERLGCGSGLTLRVGSTPDVVRHILDWYHTEEDGDEGQRADVAGIWMTGEEGTEEKKEEREVRRIADKSGVYFKLWKDEKFYVDDDDLPFGKDGISDLPNIFTSYRKSIEPLRSRPRKTLPTPTTLPPLPPIIPPQQSPFEIPSSLEGIKECLLKPLHNDPTFGLPSPPGWPTSTESGHPFTGGESAAQARLSYILSSGAVTSYKATRNGMLGLDYSTKLSAYLAQGQLTARQIHWAMVDFEEGRGVESGAEGYGEGENDGTTAIRFELLWRDYMRLCLRKFGARMFDIHGISQHPQLKAKSEDGKSRKRWKYLERSNGAGDDPAKTRQVFERFRSGRTGIGLIDAANREVFLTGYTSNRARQNVASFLTAHLGIDWRIGSEWYEFLLTDYDVASNWGNWQYVAGVGNDPRQGRVFNPVKQALDYDKKGEYIKAWVPELRGVQLASSDKANKNEEVDPYQLLKLYQAWRLSTWEKEELGLRGLEWVDDPLVRIQFSVNRGRGLDGGLRGRGGGMGGGGGRGKGRSRGKDFRRLGNEEKAVRDLSASSYSEIL